MSCKSSVDEGPIEFLLLCLPWVTILMAPSWGDENKSVVIRESNVGMRVGKLHVHRNVTFVWRARSGRRAKTQARVALD